jgi:hypothetical protein
MVLPRHSAGDCSVRRSSGVGKAVSSIKSYQRNNYNNLKCKGNRSSSAVPSREKSLAIHFDHSIQFTDDYGRVYCIRLSVEVLARVRCSVARNHPDHFFDEFVRHTPAGRQRGNVCQQAIFNRFASPAGTGADRRPFDPHNEDAIPIQPLLVQRSLRRTQR